MLHVLYSVLTLTDSVSSDAEIHYSGKLKLSFSSAGSAHGIMRSHWNQHVGVLNQCFACWISPLKPVCARAGFSILLWNAICRCCCGIFSWWSIAPTLFHELCHLAAAALIRIIKYFSKRFCTIKTAAEFNIIIEKCSQGVWIWIQSQWKELLSRFLFSQQWCHGVIRQSYW